MVKVKKAWNSRSMEVLWFLADHLPAQAYPIDMGCPEIISRLKGCKYCALCSSKTVEITEVFYASAALEVKEEQ